MGRLTSAQIIESIAKSDAGGCMLWPRGMDNGYGRLNYRGAPVRAHRLICILVHGEPPTSKHHAAHSCGNPSCVNPKHLRWATPSENSFDRDHHGTMPHGETHWNRRLTEQQVLDIAQSREPVKQIMRRLGVGERTVYDIRQGRTWSRVTGVVR